MQLWQVEHFFFTKRYLCTAVVLYTYTGTFFEEKVFNLSELHFYKVTSYKIHTLELTTLRYSWSITYYKMILLMFEPNSLKIPFKNNISIKKLWKIIQRFIFYIWHTF